MKKYLFLFLALILFIITFLFGCEYFQLMSYKEWLEKNNKKVAVYAIGTINSTACYWKNNNKPVYLPDCTGDAQSIFVYNHDVYVAGQDSSGYASYWKNGEKVSLSSIAGSYSAGIHVVDGVVFNAVRVTAGLAELWRDNQKYELKAAGALSNREPACLFVEKNGFGDFDVIVGGSYRPSPDYPCYWSNWGNKLVMLNNTGANSIVNSVFLYNNKVYSCGTDGTAGYCWIDNTVKYSGLGTSLNSIYVDKGDIYIAGQGINNYWKNGNPINTLGPAYSIKVFNEDVYLGGQSGALACYFINSSGPYYFNDDGMGSSAISTSGSSIFVTWDY